MRAPLLSLLVLVGCGRTEWMGSLGRGDAPPAGAPNVLVVSIDTLRADHLPAYGYGRDTAPTLTAIAAEGALMERTWSQAPQTDGTHASLFTGRFASSHGKFSHLHKLGNDEVTFAEYFRESGYRTWAVATSLKFLTKSGFDQGFEDWDLFAEGPVVARGDEAMSRALTQMQAEGDTPWLGFVHLFDVHAPYTPPPPHRQLFLDGPPAVKPKNTIRWLRKHRRDPVLPAEKVRALVNLYDGGIHHADSRIAQLWDAVKAHDRETILVITSDHGEAFHEHQYLGHSEVLWEEVMRIPWMVWAPQRVTAGQRIDTVAQSADLFPTIVDLAQLPAAPDRDGASFAPALRGDGPAPPDDRVVALQENDTWGIVRQLPGGVYKLTTRVGEKKRERIAAGEATRIVAPTLYNLTDDPKERLDIAAHEPEIVALLVDDLKALGSDDPNRNTIERTDMTDEELEGLRAIGYVE